MYGVQAANLNPISRFGGEGYAPDATALLVSGGNAGLKPERAESWSAGVDIRPQALPGFGLELSYFETHYTNRVVTPITLTAQALTNFAYAAQLTYSPDASLLEDVLAGADTFVNATSSPYDPANVAVLIDNRNTAPSSPREVPASDVQHADEAAGLKMPGSEPAVASGKEGFARQLETRSSRNAQVLEPAASSRVLMAGSVIAASLVIGINSDLPGMVIAQVTRNVFDSITGRVLLIPQGSRLIGNYDSQVSYGQSRVLLVWQRLVLPDGRSLRLDNMPASDPQGFAGLEDKLNAHTGRLLKGAAIATLLSVGTELSLSGDSDLVDAIRQGTQGSVSRAGDSITRRNLDVAPTIEVRPGAPVRLLVRQDLVLGPWIKENAQ
ncbi:TonB-dependent receptor [Novosphingobium sp. BW1]|nr:TonB-dependent receptor [Novosphingobium sp. BW1]